MRAQTLCCIFNVECDALPLLAKLYLLKGLKDLYTNNNNNKIILTQKIIHAHNDVVYHRRAISCNNAKRAWRPISLSLRQDLSFTLFHVKMLLYNLLSNFN